MNPKHNRHKENTPKHIIIKLLKSSDKEKILNISKEKSHVTGRGTKKNKDDNRFLFGNKASQETRGQAFKILKDTHTHSEFCGQQGCQEFFRHPKLK